MPFRMGGTEIDYKFPLEKAPKHIGYILICPKQRKRGDHVIVHFRLKKLEIPMNYGDEGVKEELDLMMQNIFEVEVKPLLRYLVESKLLSFNRGKTK